MATSERGTLNNDDRREQRSASQAASRRGRRRRSAPSSPTTATRRVNRLLGRARFGLQRDPRHQLHPQRPDGYGCTGPIRRPCSRQWRHRRHHLGDAGTVGNARPRAGNPAAPAAGGHCEPRDDRPRAPWATVTSARISSRQVERCESYQTFVRSQLRAGSHAGEPVYALLGIPFPLRAQSCRRNWGGRGGRRAEEGSADFAQFKAVGSAGAVPKAIRGRRASGRRDTGPQGEPGCRGHRRRAVGTCPPDSRRWGRPAWTSTGERLGSRHGHRTRRGRCRGVRRRSRT